MARRSYTQAEIDIVRAMYEEWAHTKDSPEASTAEELAQKIAKKLGRPYSKPMMYLHRRRGWREGGLAPDEETATDSSLPAVDGAEGLGATLQYLTARTVALEVELEQANQTIKELRKKLRSR